MNTIDIDTGGTFTDGVFRLDDGVITVKVDTTPHDPVKCFMACIEQGANALGMTGPELLEKTDVIRYATTAATNAIVQMKGPKIGLLVSAGAENHLYAGQTASADGGDNDSQAPISKFLDHSLVAGINEAVDNDGVVTTRLDEESFRTAVEQFLDGGARLLVVAFQGADLNPANELRPGNSSKPCCRHFTWVVLSCCSPTRSARPARMRSASTALLFQAICTVNWWATSTVVTTPYGARVIGILYSWFTPRVDWQGSRKPKR